MLKINYIFHSWNIPAIYSVSTPLLYVNYTKISNYSQYNLSWLSSLVNITSLELTMGVNESHFWSLMVINKQKST